VPSEVGPVLAQLGLLEASDFESLLLYADSIDEPPVSVSDLASRLQKKMDKKEVSAEALVRLAVWVSAVAYSGDRDPSRFGSVVVHSAEGIAEESMDVLVERLAAMAKLDGVQFLAKSLALLQEANFFCASSKVITDLRPVFIGDDPKGLIVTHTLRIDSADADAIFVRLSNDSLRSLKRQIDGAVKKAAALREPISETGLLLVDFSAEDEE